MSELLTITDAADASASSHRPACLNCGAVLVGPFCGHCGQKTPQQDPTLREFLHETTKELTEWDGKVPQTLIALLIRPGVLTVDWLAGRRQRWLPPLRLYLLASLVFFLSGPAVERITHRSAREAEKLIITKPDGSKSLTPEARAAFTQGILGRAVGPERIERAATHMGDLDAAVNDAHPKAMFLLLPLFALLTSVAWRGKRRRYPAHVYLALHLHAAWFIAFAVVAIVTPFIESDALQTLIAFVGFAYAAWYTVVALRRVFGESVKRTLAKTIAVAAVYAPAWFLVSFGLLAYAVATM